MVQLSVLLCLIPLTLENAMMQAHVTQVWHSACQAQRLSTWSACYVLHSIWMSLCGKQTAGCTDSCVASHELAAA
jgi:hypothetical protein